MRRLRVLCLAFVALWPLAARADAALEVVAIGKTPIRIDGDLRDWRGVRFARIGSGDDGALEYALGYDEDALVVGARVHDDDFVRTRQPSPAEDAIVLRLAFPTRASAAESCELWLYAGVPGKQRAELTMRAGSASPVAVHGATISEGPLDEARGYVIEARIPWKALPGGADFGVASGAIVLHDVDRKAGAPAHESASAGTKAGVLPHLMVHGATNAAIAAFLETHNLGSASVRFDLLGDVQGDARLERVVVAGTLAAVAGPEIDAGNGYSFVDLPAPLASDVQDAVLRDEDGDGKVELVVRLRDDPAPHVYAWQGARLSARASETSTQRAPVSSAAPAPTPSHAAATSAPAAPTGTSALIAAFRKARGIAEAERPRFVQRVNLVEDERPESLLLFGKELLLVGKGFRGGQGFFYFALPVREPDEILRLFTGDVTGDGRREVFVRTRQTLGDVQRELLFVYGFDNGGMHELLAVEVRREQAGKRIANRVALVPMTGHFVLQIEGGVAEGWDARSYPFIEDSIDANAPILLPWRNSTQHYRFDGVRLVAEP